jgi:hypothetical protein
MVTSSVVSSAQPTAPHKTALRAVDRSSTVLTGHTSVEAPVHVGPQSLVTAAAGKPKVLSKRFKSV